MDKNRIRARKSYADWNRWLEFLSRKPKPLEIMKRVHATIDSYKGFHSETNSCYSSESLSLLAKDKRLNKRLK